MHPHPAHGPVGASLLDRHSADRRPGETGAAHLERLLAERAGRPRAEVARELEVPLRTLARWVAALRARGVDVPGAHDGRPTGPGSRGGTSPATRSRARREGVTSGHTVTRMP